MRKVCLVTSEIVGPFKNGGIGTHNFYLMQYLAEIEDISCTVVYNGAIEEKTYSYWAEKYLSEYGAELVWIHPNSPKYQSASTSSCYWEQISDANYRYLITQEFNMIIFQEMLGGGFRAIQAKRNLGLFEQTEMVVMVHSSWQWINESMRLFPKYGLAEMLTKYLERYSVQHCDILISPSQYMLDWSSTDNPRLPDRQQVLPYLFDLSVPRIQPTKPVTELIFFGRLEQRKGLVLFLDSLLAIATEASTRIATTPAPVFLLGRLGQTEDGGAEVTINKYKGLLKDTFNIIVIDNLGHHEALSFLRTHPSALVVCPSLQDNSPFAIIENILLGTNLISCHSGGIPELFADRSRLADPTVESLSQLLLAGISSQLADLNPAYSVSKARSAWSRFLSGCLDGSQSSGPYTTGATSTDDGQPHATLIQLSKRNKNFVLHRLDDNGEDSIINESEFTTDRLRHIVNTFGCDYLILIAAGHSLSHDGERLIKRSISRSPSRILTGYSEQHERSPHVAAPLGPCLEASLAENCIGKVIAIIPVQQIINDQDKTFELLIKAAQDETYFWSFLVHLNLVGHEIDVIPDVLCAAQDTVTQPESAASIYNQRSQILASMSMVLPKWTCRLLPYVTDLSPPPSDESTPVSPQTSPRRSAKIYSFLKRSLMLLRR